MSENDVGGSDGFEAMAAQQGESDSSVGESPSPLSEAGATDATPAAVSDGAAARPLTDAERAKLAELDEQIARFEGQKRWSDVIKGVLAKAEIHRDPEQKVELLSLAGSLFLEKSSNQAEAIKAYEAVLQIAPSNVEAITRLKEMYEKRRDWEKLVESYKTIVARELGKPFPQEPEEQLWTAIGAVFGNPFITAFMILEFAAIGLAPGALVLPVLVALGASYLVQVGIWGIPGVGTHSLGVPGMPAYNDITIGDLAGAAAVAILAGIVTLIAREGGLRFGQIAERSPVPALYLGALVTAAALTAAMLGFDVEMDQILFSGEYGMAGLITETSVITVLAILIFKAIAYTVALGGGFRGGPIFPATFLGVAVAVGGALLLPDASVSALAAAGIAAATAAMIKLPATSALLGALLIGGSGSAIAPFAILGAVIGLGIRLAADRRDARSTASPIEPDLPGPNR